MVVAVAVSAFFADPIYKSCGYRHKVVPKLLRNGDLRVHNIDQRQGLGEIPEGLNELKQGKVSGKRIVYTHGVKGFPQNKCNSFSYQKLPTLACKTVPIICMHSLTLTVFTIVQQPLPHPALRTLKTIHNVADTNSER